ncbi:hypothetical protein BC828DRAFT_416317 [Blastocladiella britannica]|nr:hypothetical protein BC828DRAFT_416317 [Blastocladiella britannica]
MDVNAELFTAARAGNLEQLRVIIAANPDLDPLVGVHAQYDDNDDDPMEIDNDALPPIDWQWDELLPALNDLNNHATMADDYDASTTTCTDDTVVFLESTDEDALREYIDHESPDCALLAAAVANELECVELLVAHCRAAEIEMFPWEVLLYALARAPFKCATAVFDASAIEHMLAQRPARVTVLCAAASLNLDPAVVKYVLAAVASRRELQIADNDAAARFAAAVDAEFPTLVKHLIEHPTFPDLLNPEVPWAVTARALSDLASQGDAANVVRMLGRTVDHHRAIHPNDEAYEGDPEDYRNVFVRAVVSGNVQLVRTLLASPWSEWIGGYHNEDSLSGERNRLVRIAVAEDRTGVFVELARNPRFSITHLWTVFQLEGFSSFGTYPISLELLRKPMDAYLWSLVADPSDEAAASIDPIQTKKSRIGLLQLPDLVLDDLTAHYLDARSFGRLRQTCREGSVLPIPSQLLPMRLMHTLLSGQHLAPSAASVFSKPMRQQEVGCLVQLRWLIRAAERGDANALEYAMSQLPAHMAAPKDLVPIMFLWAMHEIAAWSDHLSSKPDPSPPESALVNHAKRMLGTLMAHPQCPWWRLGTKSIVRAVLASSASPVPLPSDVQSLKWRLGTAIVMGDMETRTTVLAQLAAEYPNPLEQRAASPVPDNLVLWSPMSVLQGMQLQMHFPSPPTVVDLEEAFRGNRPAVVAAGWGTSVTDTLKGYQLDDFAYKCIAGRAVAAAAELVRVAAAHPAVAAEGIANAVGRWAGLADAAGQAEVARTFLDAVPQDVAAEHMIAE